MTRRDVVVIGAGHSAHSVAAPRRDVVVIGAGHNGLIAGCYLAMAGLNVEVVERDTVPGGAVSTVERWPGVRVDRGSSLHVMFRHTEIADELDLAAAGLVYDDVDPFVVAPAPGAPAIVLSTDLDVTCTDIETTISTAAADGYRRFINAWLPRWEALLRLAGADSAGAMTRAGLALAGREWRRAIVLPKQFLASADAAIDQVVDDERLASVIGWWAAQAGPAPHQPGTAPVAGSLALMHRRPPGRPRGGSGALSTALVTKLAASGGTLRLGDAATAIDTGPHGVTAVRTASGERIQTRTVVAACHASATFGLLGRPDLASRLRIGDGIGLVLRLLTDAVPTYDGDSSAADRGMTFLVRSRDQLRRAAADAAAGEPSTDPPMLVMTPTVADPALASEGRHVVTIWSQWSPYHLRAGDWDSRKEAEADRLLAAAENWAPGLTSSVLERWVQTPLDLERELGLPQGDVMHLAMKPAALFALRPLPRWSRRTPVPGLYLTGASTHPGGGVWGASGRVVARTLIRDLRS